MSKLDVVTSAIRSEPQRVVVASDYDGTLAPIVEDPAKATPDPAAIEALGALAERIGLVAVVSGRPGEFLRRMVGLDSVVYVGLYGLERHTSEPGKWRRAIGTAARSAGELLEAHPNDFHIEDKGLALVVHYRSAPDANEASRTAREWASQVSSRVGLRVLEGKMNIELLPPIPLGKGEALRDLLGASPARFEAAVFIGDDVGDLQAFEALGDWVAEGEGRAVLRVAVASEELDPAVEHAADLVLASQKEVAAFLAGLAKAANEKRNKPGD